MPKASVVGVTSADCVTTFSYLKSRSHGLQCPSKQSACNRKAAEIGSRSRKVLRHAMD